MTAFNRKAPWIILLGDLIAFTVSLWITLSLRYVETAGRDIFVEHLMPFSLLFVVWILVFFISGLYDKQSIVFKSRLPGALIQVQVVNILIATAFFYFIPWYGISPKTTLFLYLLVSLCFILAWRIYGYFLLAPKTLEKGVIMGGGEEMRELTSQIRRSRHYNIDLVSVIDVDHPPVEDVWREIRSTNASLVIIDMHNEKVTAMLPRLYDLLFSQVRFISMDRVYEDVFDRVPLSLVKHNWFLENISATPKFVYDTLKRAMDIVISFILGLISLVFYPFVALAVKLEDGGPIFFRQIRIGKNNEPVSIVKFRSMGVHGESDGLAKEVKVTKVGAFIRKTRIDELPQLWNVIRGDISMIGPRPEVPALVSVYEREVPYYNIRHLIKPGLSGWAQIYHKTPPKFEVSKEDTKMKVSYDLYYIKNRSFMLDLNIALKTIKEIVSRKGL